MLDRYLTDEEIQMIREDGYHDNGLRYSLEELNNVSPIGKTIEELSEYVDAITYVRVRKNQHNILRNQLQELREGERIHVSVTGLGNLAYTGLYSTDAEIREKAQRIFYQIVNGQAL